MFDSHDVQKKCVLLRIHLKPRPKSSIQIRFFLKSELLKQFVIDSVETAENIITSVAQALHK